MQYHFNEIEAKWQKYWADNQTFKAINNSDKPKYYVLDMFPYPSGAGLHVGHPLGYIASDIYARYKRHKGFNVLHPQGYDSFGLPAEQYAIQTGQHPAITTETNIKTYRRQLDQIGFSFDWSREVRTSNPDYYKWTQWIFIQLFESYYCKDSDMARPISELISVFEAQGNSRINAACDDDIELFSAEEWNSFSSEVQQDILLQYRLTYLAETEVNWCPALGTVLANDEIVNGVSERGGHPVIRKKMTQWSMRISAYAERLLQGLETIDWTDSLKESQRNWIGKSVGASVTFNVLSPTLSKGKGADSRHGYLTGGNNSHLLIERAKEMRTNPTPAEAVLWTQLKGKQLDAKFRQQHLINDFIVDFVCLDKKLIIEVDGEIHNNHVEADALRTEILENDGYKVIRFTNAKVLTNVEEVLSEILKELTQRESVKSEQVLPLGKDLGWEIEVFTTRPDTIFGVSFMTLAPEHELVSKITTEAQKAEVEAYIEATAKRSERDRMADVKTISGAFTGAYAEHPFSKEPIPIWIGDYVLAGYGTGAVMSVPCGDQRDYDFAKHFNIPIPNIFEGVDISEEAFASKDNVKITNSDFLNGLNYKKATKTAIYELEKLGQGEGKTNYRLRDAVFSRQRYWGEPFPVYYVNGKPQMIDKAHLPIVLPEVEKYLPTEEGEPPLGRADVWAWNVETNEVVSNDLIDNKNIFPLELNTMPGWAGSSWYFFRYMEEKANRDEAFATEDALTYWENVDLYIGGSEHATGHLLYSRFWVKFMKDRGFVGVEEPFKKLINQGMILGTSAFMYVLHLPFGLDYKDDKTKASDADKAAYSSFFEGNIYISKTIYDNRKNLSVEDRKNLVDFIDDLKDKYHSKNPNHILVEAFDVFDDFESYCNPIHVNVEFVNSSNELIIDDFKSDYGNNNAQLLLENGNYIVGREVEKMSKSKLNVVNPDAICEQYGADSLRLYEMFLGPLEQAKPWNTAGISGVHGFLKKLWKLYVGDSGLNVNDAEPTKDNLKTLHKTIKKVEEDIENFSFNTSVSTFMIAVNELTTQKCTSKAILEPLLVLISPYAPHIAEELWSRLGNDTSISTTPFPKFEEKHLVESSKNYPISFNGKMRFTLELPLDMSKEDIEKTVMAHEKTIAQLEGRTPKKVIVVPGKIVNIVG
ncbi:leucine--tRNA ligase [Psychroserpens mesophilus]|uniref:leucine--tRNA ligase n=1 Tax=Psychroserpens mesophilus TaxID=325473 RepID=UPI003D647880